MMKGQPLVEVLGQDTQVFGAKGAAFSLSALKASGLDAQERSADMPGGPNIADPGLNDLVMRNRPSFQP